MLLRETLQSFEGKAAKGARCCRYRENPGSARSVVFRRSVKEPNLSRVYRGDYPRDLPVATGKGRFKGCSTSHPEASFPTLASLRNHACLDRCFYVHDDGLRHAGGDLTPIPFRLYAARVCVSEPRPTNSRSRRKTRKRVPSVFTSFQKSLQLIPEGFGRRMFPKEPCSVRHLHAVLFFETSRVKKSILEKLFSTRRTVRKSPTAS